MQTQLHAACILINLCSVTFLQPELDHAHIILSQSLHNQLIIGLVMMAASLAYHIPHSSTRA